MYNPLESNKADLIRINANEMNLPLESKWQEKLVKGLNETFINRYPDSNANDVVTAAAKRFGVTPSQVVAGNGSDEILDVIFKTYTSYGKKVLSLAPSFVMYELLAKVYRCDFIPFRIDPFEKIDIDALIACVEAEKPSLIFICNPNNPTGQLISTSDLSKLLETNIGMVVVDEAYAEFIGRDYKANSMIKAIESYHNLIVLKTLSKAYGSAGLRVGFGLTNESNQALMLEHKFPYNISQISQTLAKSILSDEFQEPIWERIDQTLLIRDKVFEALKGLKGLRPVPSYGNFIWFQSDLVGLENALLEKDIAIRAFKGSNHYRVTIGTDTEMDTFINALQNIIKEADDEK